MRFINYIYQVKKEQFQDTDYICDLGLVTRKDFITSKLTPVPNKEIKQISKSFLTNEYDLITNLFGRMMYKQPVHTTMYVTTYSLVRSRHKNVQ